MPGRLEFAFEEVEAGAACYRRTGEELPRESLEVCQAADAILFGAAGLPDVRFPDGTEIAPQLTLRIALDLYVGLRPIRLHPGVPTPLRLGERDRIDYVILRENTEGLYASRGAGVLVGGHVATDTLVVTRPGVLRICRQAFELARRRRGAPRDGVRRVTLVDKANVLKSYAFFRALFDEVAADYPDVEAEHAYVDAMTMYLVQRPGHYDVVVAENMFGDILSDLAAATVGGLGMAPSGRHRRPLRPLPAFPRDGARHRRQGHRESPRDHPLGRAHARVARPARRQRRGGERGWADRGGGRCRDPRRPSPHAGPRRPWDDGGRRRRRGRGTRRRARSGLSGQKIRARDRHPPARRPRGAHLRAVLARSRRRPR